MKKIISAIVTPLDAAGSAIDAGSARRLFQWGLECGLDGFFVFGSMGEWQHLTTDMQQDLATVACETVGERARLIFGITDTSITRSLEKMDRLRSFSHSHWTLLLPPGTADPVAAMHRVADAADRPVFLYHCPPANGVNLSAAQFQAIFEHPRVAGVKNSAGAMRVRKELLVLKARMDFELYEGEEWAIDEAMALGCDGTICGFGTMGARVLKAIAAAVDAGDLVEANRLQMELIGIFHIVYGQDVGWWCAGQKYGLAAMGVIEHATCLTETQRDLPAERRGAIDQCVRDNPRWFAPAGR